MTGSIDGVPFRVVDGVKFPGDLVLQWFVGSRWRNVPMSIGALIADFMYENEEYAMPRERGYEGGNYYLSYVCGAAYSGWKQADRRLQENRKKQLKYRRHTEPSQT